MNDIESLRKQIRFQLAQLRSDNAHHQFEDLCLHLTRHRICSNILPATGPVSAGGDQGRDFETFRTYLAEHRLGDCGGDHGDFHELTERSDALVAKRHGGFAAASRARDRAIQFYDKGDIPRAIRELHRARLNWFAKETLGISVLAFLTISSWYREISLSFAAKYYALAAAFIAAMSDDNEIRKRLHQGLALAAESDYEHGAWCGYLEMVAVAERAAFLVLPSTERDIPEPFQNVLYAGAMVTALTERLVPERIAYVAECTSRLALHETVSELVPAARTSVEGDEGELRARIEAQFTGPPFADLGEQRVAAWSAYGTEWRLSWQNTYTATAVAEEFCAIFQIFLADIHGLDLYLLPTTVDIQVDVQDAAAPSLAASPSNATRMWTATLPANQTGEGFHELQEKVFIFGIMILSELSLLPREELIAIIERLFLKGLRSKTRVARPYSELFRYFTVEDMFNASKREEGPSPSHWHPLANERLPWVSSEGWSYEPEDALNRVRARYKNGVAGLEYTLPRLCESAAFQSVVEELRRAGWRDWHIVTAVLNATMNHRINARIDDGEDPKFVFEEYGKRFAQAYDERLDELAPPTELYTADMLRESLQRSYLSTLKQLGFTIHQNAPDFPAIDEFLRHRYHYWDDDVEHEDPFTKHEQTKET